MIQLSYCPAPFIADESNISVFILAIHGFCDYYIHESWRAL